MDLFKKGEIYDEGIGYDIIDETDHFVIIHKRNGLAVQATDTGVKDLETILTERYGQTIYVINRIDQPVSGLVIFGKHKGFTKAMTEEIKQRTVKKTYLAIVAGQPEQGPITVKHYLKKLHNRAMTADEQLDDSYKEARLTYTLLQHFDNYHLLKIDLHTGRFHQIRAQLATIDLPIKGDLKYGSRRPNLDRSICLLSYKLAFTDPINNKEYSYTAPLPQSDVLWSVIEPELLSCL
jgi:23S rRNA pseudouridine1911/1915/1917 synthase